MIRTADHNLNYIDNYEVLLFANLKKKEEHEKKKNNNELFSWKD